MKVDDAKWRLLPYDQGAVLEVRDKQGRPCRAFLEPRPRYCDRGHWYVKIDGCLGLDADDGFPRYFFSLAEADYHVRKFLRWRIWKDRGLVEDLALVQNLPRPK